MLINIKEIRDKEVLSITEDFEKKGGQLLFRLFRISKNYEGFKPTNKYDCHLSVARQTIERINFEINFHWNRVSSKGNRNSFPINTIDFDDLDHSGIEIDIEEFLGPYYDLKLGKPIIKGVEKNGTYYYFDEAEKTENLINIRERKWQFENKKSMIESIKHGYATYGFIDAFLLPPHGLNIGKTIKDQGDYLVNLVEFLFTDLKNIEIMKWSTDCSPFFKSGKEWWGTFFWTIYNPTKDWYIGICGSSTD